jgi:hypothetical protein
LNLLVSKVETEHLLEKLKAHTRDVNDDAWKEDTTTRKKEEELKESVIKVVYLFLRI